MSIKDLRKLSKENGYHVVHTSEWRNVPEFMPNNYFETHSKTDVLNINKKSRVVAQIVLKHNKPVELDMMGNHKPNLAEWKLITKFTHNENADFDSPANRKLQVV